MFDQLTPEYRPEKGWLSRQLAAVEWDVAEWPEWMKQESGKTMRYRKPYAIGWFRDPLVDSCVFFVSRISNSAWFITPYESKGDRCSNGVGHVLTMAAWKRLEQI